MEEKASRMKEVEEVKKIKEQVEIHKGKGETENQSWDVGWRVYMAWNESKKAFDLQLGAKQYTV